VEIFPAHYEDRAWRLSLFGDELEAISEFDPLTGERTDVLESVKVYANSHYVTPRPTLNQAIKQIKAELIERLSELNAQGKLLETAYWPVGEAIPAKYADWDREGTWEVRDVKGGDAVMWRDFTNR
jgi:transcription-repair coupling factor (superfamily II helicase)